MHVKFWCKLVGKLSVLYHTVRPDPKLGSASWRVCALTWTSEEVVHTDTTRELRNSVYRVSNYGHFRPQHYTEVNSHIHAPAVDTLRKDRICNSSNLKHAVTFLTGRYMFYTTTCEWSLNNKRTIAEPAVSPLFRRRSVKDVLGMITQPWKKPRSDAHSRCNQVTGVEHAPPHDNCITELTAN